MSDDTPTALVHRHIHAVLRRVHGVHQAAADAAAAHYGATAPPAERTTAPGATSGTQGGMP